MASEANWKPFFSKTATDVNTPVNRNLGCKNLQEPQNWQMDSNIHTSRLNAWPINDILKWISAQIAASVEQQHCISLVYDLITTSFLWTHYENVMQINPLPTGF